MIAVPNAREIQLNFRSMRKARKPDVFYKLLIYYHKSIVFSSMNLPAGFYPLQHQEDFLSGQVDFFPGLRQSPVA